MYETLLIILGVVFFGFTIHKVYQLGVIREDIKILQVLRASIERVPYEHKEGALVLANIQLKEMEQMKMMEIGKK